MLQLSQVQDQYRFSGWVCEVVSWRQNLNVSHISLLWSSSITSQLDAFALTIARSNNRSNNFCTLSIASLVRRRRKIAKKSSTCLCLRHKRIMMIWTLFPTFQQSIMIGWKISKQESCFLMKFSSSSKQLRSNKKWTTFLEHVNTHLLTTVTHRRYLNRRAKWKCNWS